MPARYVNIDRQTPMLLPVDLREWVAEDDLAHFVLEAVEKVELSRFVCNERGSGSEQYPPRMMLALLIYCYSQGIFGSRRIEVATYQHLSVRYVAANTHPDHDTICTFRRRNFTAVAECFVRVLELAREIGLLRVGTVSVDGTRLAANASKHRNISYQRAGELVELLKADVAELLARAESADGEPQPKEGLPEELARREKLREKLEAARAQIEERVRQKAQSEQAAYEAKVQARAERHGRHKGVAPQPPKQEPQGDELINLTDADSRLMCRSQTEAFVQSYNAQAAVCAEGSQLILAARVSQCAADRHELEPTLEAIPAEAGTPNRVLVDSGYLNGPAWERVSQRGVEVYGAVRAQASMEHRRYEFRDPEQRSERPFDPKDPQLVAMKEKLETPEGRAIYGRRKCSVEPVFGIIKQTLGFRQFLLRGVEKVGGEWQLVALSYNCKRLDRLRRRSAGGDDPPRRTERTSSSGLPRRPVCGEGAKGSSTRGSRHRSRRSLARPCLSRRCSTSRVRLGSVFFRFLWLPSLAALPMPDRLSR